MGLATVLGCTAAGAKQIIGIDVNEDKFDIGTIRVILAFNTFSLVGNTSIDL